MRIWRLYNAALDHFRRSRVARPQSKRQARGLAFEQLEDRHMLSTLGGTVHSTVNSHTYVLAGVTMSISGTDANSNVIASQSVKTGSDGTYQFTNLPVGIYTITEAHPAAIVDGSSVAGSLGGTVAANKISGINVAANATGTGYNFEEKGLAANSINVYLASAGTTQQILNNAVAASNASATTFSITSVTSPVNAANAASASVNGTGAIGTSVSLVVSDGTHSSAAKTTIVGANGTWSITGIDLSALSDGTITYTATGTRAGTTSTSALNATKDSAVPTVAVNSVTNSIGLGNQHATSASGTGEAGASISVSVSDGTHTTTAVTTTVAGNGTWTVSNIDVSSLNDGTITFKATATDAASNTATSSKTATKDTVAPAVAVTTVTNPISTGNSGNTSASGTGEAGASISVVASDGTNSTAAVTTTVSAGGVWSVSGLAVTTLNDGTITFKATATDTAGNTATSSLSSVKTSSPANFATDDSYDLAIGATLTTTTANGVLANDTGASNAILISGPSHGSVNLNADGTFSYTQTTYGYDQFVYQVTNSSNQTDQATVTIQVPGLPKLPAGAVLVTLPSGLQYYDYVVGTGASPAASATVNVDYVGYLPTGAIFDSHNNINFKLSNLIAGFSEGVQGMQVGGSRRLIIPPSIGYGPGGNPGAGIGGTDTIIFDVKLNGIV
ncbi:MAG: FKBP-type peptidyl-prolyl cis-trans isomerase [Planctomycetia bacterium]|nr:FKBP-type peptidyl-prolyl cis-trans isomerase [Planctomycetia bacterium]